MEENGKKKLSTLQIVLIVIGSVILANAIFLGGIFVFEKIKKNRNTNVTPIVESKELKKSQYSVSLKKRDYKTLAISFESVVSIDYVDIEIVFLDENDKVISSFTKRMTNLDPGVIYGFTHDLSFLNLITTYKYKANVTGRRK